MCNSPSHWDSGRVEKGKNPSGLGLAAGFTRLRRLAATENESSKLDARRQETDLEAFVGETPAQLLLRETVEFLTQTRTLDDPGQGPPEGDRRRDHQPRKDQRNA